MRIILLLLITTSLNAGWLERKAEGWAWYEDPEQLEPEVEIDQSLTKSEQLAQVRKDLEESLAAAVIDPSPKRVEEYLRLQQKWVNQSALFARAWNRLLLSHPELDERSRSPVSQYGIQVRKQEKQRARDRLIRSLAADHGLFFFFEGESPYSQAFAKVVSAFAKQYGWEVLAVTLDGKALPEFPNPHHDNGIVQQFQVPSLPALYVVNPKRNIVSPLAYGLLSLEQIEGNVMLQFQQEESDG